MDQTLTTAKRHWKTTGEKTRFLTALLRSGREDILNKLCALWDPDAFMIHWGVDLEKMEEASDHIDAICGCITCSTLAQLAGRLKEVDLWTRYLQLFTQEIETNFDKYSEKFYRQYRGSSQEKPALFDLLCEEAILNIQLRRQITRQMITEILESC